MRLFPRFLPLLSLLLAALTLAGCSAKPLTETEAVKRFFEQIGSGKAEEAYASASFGFRAQQTQAVFVQTTRELGLMEIKEIRVSPPDTKGRDAKLGVDIDVQAGKSLHFDVSLIEENGAWRVYALRSAKEGSAKKENRFSLVGRGAAFTDALSQTVPEERRVKSLTTETMQRFADAVEQEQFEAFHAEISDAWKTQVTAAQVKRAFQPFIDRGVKLGGLRSLEPVYDGPALINTEGLLVVTGYYPTQPYKVWFSLRFIYELPRWRLFGIDVDLQQ